MKKLFQLSGICLALLIIFSGCASEDRSSNINNQDWKKELKTLSDNIDNTSISAMIKSTPNNISLDFQNGLIIDTEVSMPEAKEFPRLSVENFEIDEQTVISTFFNNIQPQKKVINDTVYNTITYKLNDKDFTIVNGDFTYSVPNVKLYELFFMDEGNPDGKWKISDRFSTSSELEFKSRKEAIEQTENIIKSFGIKTYGEPKVYSFDITTMDTIKQEYIKENSDFLDSKFQIPDYKKEDEMYYMEFRLNYNNIPVTKKNITVPSLDRMVGDCQLKVYYSKDGIIAFEANGVYKIKELLETPTSLVNVYSAIEAVIRQQDNIIKRGITTKITNIDLEYVNIPVLGKSFLSYELVPCWTFSIIEEDENGKGEYVKLVNAISGEMIE